MPSRRNLLLSTLILTGVLATATSSQAEVPTGCNLDQQASGVLVGVNSPLPTRLTSYSAQGGTPGRIILTCDISVNVMVGAPIQTSGPSFQPITSLRSVTASTGGTTDSSQGASPLVLPVGATTLTTDLDIEKGSPLTAGSYGFNLSLTIVP